MLRSHKGKEIIRLLRPQQLLTETDGPYVKIGKERPAVPQDIRAVIDSLAQTWRCPVENAVEIIRQNYQRACR